MCSYKSQNDKVHPVNRWMYVKQLTHVESIKVGVHVLCFAPSNASYWQISFCSPPMVQWMCRHHFATSCHISTRVCPWHNMWIVWCVRASTNFIESDLFYALWWPWLQHAMWIASLLPELTIGTASSLDYQSTNLAAFSQFLTSWRE